MEAPAAITASLKDVDSTVRDATYNEKQLEAGSQISSEKSKDAQMDGGWRAWCSVLSSFLQFAICLGGANAFGVFQAEYSLVQFPGTSDLVSAVCSWWHRPASLHEQSSSGVKAGIVAKFWEPMRINAYRFFGQMISFIGGTMLSVLVVTCLAVGRLCELRGPRFVAILGTIIMVIALLAASWCHTVPALIATQGMWAASFGSP